MCKLPVFLYERTFGHVPNEGTPVKISQIDFLLSSHDCLLTPINSVLAAIQRENSTKIDHEKKKIH